jgi:hypothetical protein
VGKNGWSSESPSWGSSKKKDLNGHRRCVCAAERLPYTPPDWWQSMPLIHCRGGNRIRRGMSEGMHAKSHKQHIVG